MTLLKATLAAGFLLCLAWVLYVTTDTLTAFAADLAAFLAFALRVCLGTAVFVVACLCLWWLRRQSHERNRQRDGAFGLREYWVEPLPRRVVNWWTGRPSARIIYDPNANMSHAAIVGGGVLVVEPGCGWGVQAQYMAQIEQTRRAQAIAPGDAVVGNPLVSLPRGGNGIANAATGRLLAGAYDKPPRPVTVDAPPQLPQLPPPANVTLDDALARTGTQDWPLGYDDAGQLAIFNPQWHAHAAVVGSPGTGKTTSVGYLLAAHALRQGWHVVILDADSGASWTPFAMWAEHVTADIETFPAQVAALAQEVDRRMALVREAGANDVSGVPHLRRVLVIVEEYGDMLATLRLRSAKAANETDVLLDTLMRRGRKAGLHVALIDQYPERWSNQIIAGTKFRAVFQLGPNQGAKMQEYKAHELPPRGAFLLNGRTCRAWHAEPQLRRLLADVSALSTEARLLTGKAFGRSVEPVGGGATSGGERTERAAEHLSPNADPNAEPAGPTDLQEAVWRWRDAHPNGTQAEMRREFEAQGVVIARSYAHECWHKWPGCEGAPADRIDLSTAAGRAMFAQYAADARLPSGDKLGTDITGGAR